jgi:pimeloyl-ACP methyl ester carboxylesterase
MKDPAFPAPFLERWQALLTNAQTVTFPGAGHFVQEEEPAAVREAIARFIG